MKSRQEPKFSSFTKSFATPIFNTACSMNSSSGTKFKPRRANIGPPGTSFLLYTLTIVSERIKKYKAYKCRGVDPT